METLLHNILYEWDRIIVGGSFCIFFITFFFSGGKPTHNVPIPEPLGNKILPSYFLWAIYGCSFIVHIGVTCARIIDEIFSGIAFLEWCLLVLCLGFAVCFFRNTCRLLNFRPGALHAARWYLLSVPLFCAAMPYVFYYISIKYTGFSYSLGVDPFSKHIDACEGWALFLWPWLIYFCCSSKVKNLWRDIDEACTARELRP